MGIITISRGSYSRGKEVAERLSKRLGYECISRDVLLETSAEFNIDEVKLIRAIHDAPSIFERFKHGKERYVLFIREAFLKHIRKDNVVYHGLAGQFFCKGAPGVLKVRILANTSDRVKEEMAREGITEKEARFILKKDDEERRKWGMSLYGIDTMDSSLYDVVLHIDNLKVDDAVDVLADMAKRPCFQTTAATLSFINDLYLTAKTRELLFDKFPEARVGCKNGVVTVSIDAPLALEQKIVDEVQQTIEAPAIDGIRAVRVKVHILDSGD